MFRRILVPLDGSPRARQAIPLAARIARTSGGSVVLLSVLEPSLHVAWHKQLVPVLLENQTAERKRIAAELARQADAAVLHGVQTEREVVEGLPAEIILERAEERQIDLIVMSSHGRTGLTRWALGSVAQKVAYHSVTPVLLVREDGKLPAENTRSVCVMVALDGSSFAEATVRPAMNLSLALSAPLPGMLRLVQVVPLSIDPVHAAEITRGNELPYDLLPLEQTRAITAATTYLSRVQQQIQREAGGEEKLQVISSVLADPDVVGCLLAEAKSGNRREGVEGLQGCDILALATHGRSGPARWVVGSVTERVLKAATLPLLIVRPPYLKQNTDEKGPDD